jgi:hypothetical protein
LGRTNSGGENLDFSRFCQEWEYPAQHGGHEVVAGHMSRFLEDNPRIILKNFRLCQQIPLWFARVPKGKTAAVVTTYRDPSCVLRSMQKMAVSVATTRIYDDFGSLWSKLSQLDARPFFVRYEELMQSPESVLFDLCQWTGIPFYVKGREDFNPLTTMVPGVTSQELMHARVAFNLSVVKPELWRQRPAHQPEEDA